MRIAVKANVVLWIVQALLALFFGFGSGLPKLILPLDMLALPLPLPELFVRTIGVAEVAGALGLILPGITRIRTGLTPLAASGLVLLTICASVYQLLASQPESAVFAAVLGLIAASVAYGRWRVRPLAAKDRQVMLSVAA